jgi:hypothetical protein
MTHMQARHLAARVAAGRASVLLLGPRQRRQRFADGVFAWPVLDALAALA